MQMKVGMIRPNFDHPNVSRIRKARAWLHVNSQSYCEENNKPYRATKWGNSLKVYEQLVDDCPIPEVECWNQKVEVKDMEDYEVEYHANPQVDKQPEVLVLLGNSNKRVKP